MFLIGIAFVIGFILLMTFVFSLCSDVQEPFVLAMRVFWVLIGLGCIAIFLFVSYLVIASL